MRNVILGAAGLLASAVALPTVAVAAEVRFTLTNDVTPGAVTWLLPQAPTPSFFVDDFFFALDGPILGTFEGTEAGGGQVLFEGFAFLADGAGGGFNTFAFIALGGPGAPEFDIPYGVELSGPQLFTGTAEAPVFRLGVFDLTDSCSGFCTAALADFELTITAPGAIPEPGAWAMIIVGCGGVGAALRRRRATAA